MPIQKNLNVTPYNDDFNESKNFHKVLFKAGFPIQARELTQQQTIIQDQIEKLASRFLKEGDNVVPGEFSLQNNTPYVRLSTFTNGASLSDFVGYKLTGVASGVVAEVLFAAPATDTDDDCLYVSYISGGVDGESTQFLQGEVLESSDPNNLTATVGIDGTSKPLDSSAMGLGALFTVREGVYYINGMFVRNDEQTIVASKYTVRFDTKIGFDVLEEIVTASEESSLLDNSQGSSNFASPGSDRLKVTVSLAKYDREEVRPHFVKLAEVAQGNILRTPGNTVKWDWLYDILARRTFDESGDYIVTEFPVAKMEYYNTEDVDGLYDADENDLYPLVPGTTGISNENGLTQEEADDRYVLQVDPGKAYVKGYEIDLDNMTYLYGKKTRNTTFRNSTLTQITGGYNLIVTNMSGTPDIANISGEGVTKAFDSVVLYRNFTDGFVGESVDGNGRPLNVGNKPWTTYHIIADGNIGTGATGFNEIYKEGNGAVVATNLTLGRGDTIGDATILAATEIGPRPAGVINPRYLTPDALVDQGNGFYGYNSTYKLGIMSSVYFTDLGIVSVTNGGTAWTVGNLVEGEESGAIGTVEEGSTENNLIVSNVVGEFLPGEDVVQGTKVSRILRDYEISELIFTDKGTNNNTIDLSAETSVIISALGSSKSLTLSGGYVTASSGTLRLTEKGRERLRNFPLPESSNVGSGINYTLKTFPSGVTGYALSRPSKVVNTMANTKAFFSSLADTNDFSADISVNSNVDSEILDIASRSLFTGSASTNFLTCDNFSGDPSSQLVAGDVVTFVDDAGRSINRVVQFATRPVGYGDVRAKAIIYFTTTIPNDVTGKTVQRIRVKTRGTSDQTLLFQLPQEVVSTLESDSANTGISYQIQREFVLNVPSGSNTVTLTSNKNNETFINNRNLTSIVVSENVSDPTDSSNLEGRGLTTTNIDVTQDSGRKAVFTLTNTLTSSVKLKILVPVFVNDAISKRKITRTTTKTIAAADAGGDIVSLSESDVYEVTSMTMGGNNILDNYIFDDGQRDNIYDISRLILKPGRPAANADVEVTYSYFEHSGDGDFFSVDSYTSDNSIGYKNIPTYTSTSIVPQNTIYSKSKNKNTIYLRDFIDFRPAVNTAGVSPSQIASNIDGVDAQGAINFLDSSTSGNAFVPRIPIPETQFICDLEYYLPRYDSLFLQHDGVLALVAGVPDNDPEPAVGKSSAIRLYDIFLPPYVFDLNDVYIKKFNYKRYRMSDIAKIDRQLQDITELVTLSLLEQDAINISVRDAVTGLDRFKNGIVVDPFKTHANGDTILDQYRCSIDPENDHLRSPHFIDQVVLEEVAQTIGERNNQGYVKEDGVIMCEYSSSDLITQPFATRFINCQPYMIFTYDGELELFPSIDTFSDKNTIPNLVIEDNSLFDATVNLSNAMNDGGFGTVWSSWNTTTFNRPRQSRTQDARISGVRTRTQTTTTLNVDTARIEQTSMGERVVDVQLSETMRSIPVEFRATNLKPNTRYYAFFDGVDVTNWISADTIQTNFPDGRNRYSGTPNEFRGSFGGAVLSDDTGTIQGIFIIPRGRAPQEGTSFNGRMNSLSYRTSGPTRSFNTGTKRLRFTDNQNNPDDLTQVQGIAEADFTSSGVISDVQETILSTRIPRITSSSRISNRESQEIVVPVVEVTNNITNVTNVRNNITNVTNVTNTNITQTVQNILRDERQRDWEAEEARDPVAQTFSVSSDLTSEGAFISEIQVFFRTKDEVEPIMCYLTTTEGQVPTEVIPPHGLVVKQPDSVLRVECTSLDGSSTVLDSGISVVGQTSGATGILKSQVTFQSAATNPTTNVSNSIYEVILSNYNGEFIPGERIVPSVSPALSDRFVITNNGVVVDDVLVTNMGSGFTSATVSFSAPQQPGGVAATGTAHVHDGKVYKVTLDTPGSGYTAVPSITISGDGTSAVAIARVKEGRNAVSMGVATSDDASVPTTFRFPAPVFVYSDTYYSFVLKPPTSLNYTVWTAKLGENILGTQSRVEKQPVMGSLFMSQNGGLWTDDQTQDIKFIIRNAMFSENVVGTVAVQNKQFEERFLGIDPIETNSNGSDTTSYVFGDNPKIVRVYHHMHGLVPGDIVEIDGVVGNPGGIPNEELNTIHTVIHASLDLFTIQVTTSATSSSKSGGNTVTSTYNRPYEVIDVESGIMSFATSNVVTQIEPTNATGVTGANSTNAYIKDNPTTIGLSSSYYFTKPKQVAHQINEANNRTNLGGNKSLTGSISISTQNQYVSPVIDFDRTNALVIRNLIDSPDPTDDIYGVGLRTITFSDDISGSGLTVGDSLEFNSGSGNRTATIITISNDTRKVKVSGQYAAELTTDSTFTNATLEAAGVEKVTANNVGGYYPETDNRGSAYSKWISRLFLFENPCDGIEVKIAAVFYSTSDIKCYYRPRNIGFDGDIAKENWIPFNGNGLADSVEQITARSAESVDPKLISPDQFKSLRWTVQDVPKFDGIAIKIVMTSENPALAPLLDDIQVICTE